MVVHFKRLTMKLTSGIHLSRIGLLRDFLRVGGAFTLATVLAAPCWAQGEDPKTELLFSNEDLTEPLRTRVFDDESIVVWINKCTTSPDIDFNEKKRSTRLAEEVKKLFKAIDSSAGAKAAVDCDKKGAKNPISTSYKFKYPRSELKITARAAVPEAPRKSEAGKKPAEAADKKSPALVAPERAAAPAATDKPDASTQEHTVTVIKGSPEHWYLGIDLPVTNSKTLKYDSASNSLLPVGSGHQLYLSINYLIGTDVFEADDASWNKRFSAKAFIAAQSRPFDSVGLGIGYRLRGWKALDLNGFEFFAGHFWTKQDELASGGAQLNTGTKGSWRFGISYDLSTGLGWLNLK